MWANKFCLTSFGLIEYQKQTSLDLKPPIANTLTFSGYQPKWGGTSCISRVFGLTEYQKQTTLDFIPSVAF